MKLAATIGARPANPAPQSNYTMMANLWPTLTVDMAAMLLNTDRDSVLQLIQSGSIRWAWRIGKSIRYRGTVRIYSQSLIDYNTRQPDRAGTHAVVMSQLLPVRAGNPTCTRLCEVLNCERKLAIELARAHKIKMVGVCRRGRGGSPFFSRASVVEFLEARQLC